MEEEKHLDDLVSGRVGAPTPKVVQDQRNWADGVVNAQATKDAAAAGAAASAASKLIDTTGKATATNNANAKLDKIKQPQTNSRHQGAVRILFESSVQTKQLTPTRLSTIETSVVDVIVSEGLMQQKGGFLTKSNWLSFKIKVPHIRSDVRRKDEDFDLLWAYLIKAYPNVIVPTTKAFKGHKYNEQKYMTRRATNLSRFL